MTQDITPRWLSYAGAKQYCTLGKRTLQRYIASGAVESRLVTQPGKAKGIRLIDKESLDRFIESGAQETTALESVTKKGAAR